MRAKVRPARPSPIPTRLREVAELDRYLLRLQVSTKVRGTNWRKRGMPVAADISGTLRSRIVETRAALRQEMDGYVPDLPILYSAMGVPNTPLMSVVAVLTQLDPARADSPAGFWRYCGLGVVHGYPDRVYSLIAPGRITYSTVAHGEMLKMGYRLTAKNCPPYHEVYVDYRNRLLRDGVRENVTKVRGRRYVAKLWLKHLWLAWRRIEGLPVGEAHESDRTSLAAPFGWR